MNALFKNATRALQSSARAEFRSSTVGRLLTEVEHYAKRGRLSGRHGQRLLKRMQNVKASEILAQAQKGTAGRTIERYAKGTQRKLLETVFEGLGPLGDLFRAFMRPSGRSLRTVEHELEAATALLKAFGYGVTPPPRGRSARRRANRAARKRKTRESQSWLEWLGFTVIPPKATKPPPPPKPPGHGGPIRKNRPGHGGPWHPDDPILTGEMIPVTSSNVHSIGFIYNHEMPEHGTLKVRFLQSRKGSKSTGPGPLYFYYSVDPSLFDAFRKAASKGEWVWDRLRVRGSVSGHRYEYELKGVVNGYVPRKATRGRRDDEYYVQRTLAARNPRTGEIRTMRSQLPNQYVGEAQRRPSGRRTVLVSDGVPNRGR